MPAQNKPSKRPLLSIYGPAALLTVLAFLLAYQFVEPAPPKQLVIATGSPEGAYANFARRYEALLAEQGIRLEIRHTQGSLENLALLNRGDVDVAFVQGGTEKDKQAPLLSLASLYYEPFWLFYRSEKAADRLTDLRGARVALGAQGSGTRALAEVMISDNQFPADFVQAIDMGGRDAADALQKGSIDAAFFVSGANSALIRELIQAPEVRLMRLRRAKAYARLHDYLSELLLSEGMVDMANDLPRWDTPLLASVATLVSNQQTHPALIGLLMQAIDQVHSVGGLFEARDEFPSDQYLVYPISDEAARFFKHGPPFLQRYLPFWAASMIDRLKVMLLPLVVVFIPLLKIMPPVYAWRVKAKIHRLYRDLVRLEARIGSDLEAAELQDALGDLQRIKRRAQKIHLPLSFASYAYELRLHIRLVNDELNERLKSV